MKHPVVALVSAAALAAVIAFFAFRKEGAPPPPTRAIEHAKNKIKQAEARAQAAEARASAADADNAKLLAAVDCAAKVQATGNEAPTRITRATLDAKLNHARELRKAGDLKGSFEELRSSRAFVSVGR